MLKENRWGWIALGSLLLWLIIFLAAFRVRPVEREIMSVWFAGCTGGIGTLQYLLSSLFRRKVAKQEFTQRYFIFCLVQPVLGFIVGAVLFSTGIIFGLLLRNDLVFTKAWVQVALLLVSWIVGYQIIGKSIFERYTS